ncbi:MAG: ankyrin repeat domain-containing protein [Spirochaetaceae bacterium]
MPTGIFFVDQHKSLAERIFRSLKEHGVPARPYVFSASWSDTTQSELSFLLSDILHFVIVPPPDPESEAWFSFIMGYASGRDTGVTIVGPGRQEPLPALFGRSTGSNDHMKLIQAVVEEYGIARRRQTIDRARDEIIQRGYATTDDEFARVVSDGDAELAELFLQLGMSVDTVNSSGVPVLNLAVRGGHVHVVEMLLAKNVNVNAISSDRGNTALVESSGHGMTQLTRRLLAAGAEPDIRTKSGQTALMLAVAEGHVEDAKTLLKAGADPDIKDKLGMSARKYAELFNNDVLFRLMDTAVRSDDRDGIVDSDDSASLSYARNGATE